MYKKKYTNKYYLNLFLIVLLFLNFFAVIKPVKAADTWGKIHNYMRDAGTSAGFAESVSGEKDITTILANVIRIMLAFAGAVFFVFFLLAAYGWLMSGGNEEKVSATKKKIIHSVIGLIIILIAYMFVDFLILVFTGVAGI